MPRQFFLPFDSHSVHYEVTESQTEGHMLYCAQRILLHFCVHPCDRAVCLCAAAPFAKTVGGAFQVLGLESKPSQQLMSSPSAPRIQMPRLAKLNVIKVRTYCI